jgi:dimethylhistidine N-methyltransferase
VITTNTTHLMPVGERFHLYRAPARAVVASFAEDVRAGLLAGPKRLPPKYFYDALGSALFEAICELPEYYLTRAETEILECWAAEMVAALPGPLELVEFGGGSGRKTRALLGAAIAAQGEIEYHPIDISENALVASSAALLGTFPELTVRAFASDYFEVLESARLSTSRRVLALFLGSNVGNYDPPAAKQLLRAMSAAFKPGDGLLLGTDLKKDAAVLERAYNDPTGVTAAFDKNILGRINRELGGHFDLDAFEHVARYDGRRGVIDSFLVAQRGMRVPIVDVGIEVSMRPAETIHTESSYKFDEDAIARLAAGSGFRVARTWTDPGRRFAVSLLVIV